MSGTSISLILSRWRRALGLALCMLAFSDGALSQVITTTPTLVESHGRGDAATVQALEIKVQISGIADIPIGSEFRVQFYDAAGHEVGEPETARITKDKPKPGAPPPKTPPDAKLKLNVPKAAQPVGSSVKIAITDKDDEVISSVTVQWSKGVGDFTKPMVATLITHGPPGVDPQHWSFDLPGSGSGDPLEMIFGGRNSNVIASGFDLSYSHLQGSEFNVFFTGDESFIRLADGGYVFFPDEGLIGTIDIEAGALAGLFDFSAIGLAGSWFFDPATNRTSLRAATSSDFDGAVIRSVPEPSGAILFFSAIALLGFVSGNRKKSYGKARPEVVTT